MRKKEKSESSANVEQAATFSGQGNKSRGRLAGSTGKTMGKAERP